MNEIHRGAVRSLVALWTAAAVSGCAGERPIGTPLLRRAPTFDASATWLAVRLPYVANEWSLDAIGTSSLIVRRASSTAYEGRRMRPVTTPALDCRFDLAAPGRTVAQEAEALAPADGRLHARHVETPRGEMFTLFDTDSASESRVGVFELAGGRVVIGRCLRAGEQDAGALAFYENILSSVSADPGRISGAQAHARDVGAGLVARNALPLDAMFGAGTSLTLPGPAGAWSIEPMQTGIRLRLDPRVANLNVQCLVARLAQLSEAEVVHVLTHQDDGSARGRVVRDQEITAPLPGRTVWTTLPNGRDTLGYTFALPEARIMIACVGDALRSYGDRFDAAIAESRLVPPPPPSPPPSPEPPPEPSASPAPEVSSAPPSSAPPPSPAPPSGRRRGRRGARRVR
jgi:hypothetical protein